jgi:hypothetical protein
MIGSLWLGGTVCWFALAAWRIGKFQRLLRYGSPAPVEVQERARLLAQRLRLDWCPEVWIVPGRLSPLLWSLGNRTRLVLPSGLLRHLQPDQQQTLLAHELAHALRQDHWIRWLEFVVTGLYWWHPVVWWARHEIQQAEEQCCDAWVVWALPEAARAYARALLQTVDFLDAQPNLPPAASGVGHVPLLKRRLAMIVREPHSPRVPWPVSLGALLLGLLVLPAAPQRLEARTTTEGSPVTFVDDNDGQPPRDQDARDLDRRLRDLERRLDRLLERMDSRRSQTNPDRSSRPRPPREDNKSGGDEAGARARELMERARERAQEQADRAREQAERARERAQEQTERARERAQELAERARAKALEQAAKAREKAREAMEKAKEKGEKDGTKRREQVFRFQFDGKDFGVDAKQMEQLQKQIEESVRQAVNPERMKKMEKDIQDALDKNLNPERMKQLQKQIEETVHRNFDAKRFEAMARQIEQSVNRSLQAEQRDRSRRSEQAKPTPTPAPRSGARTERNQRDLERRVERLEEKMDRILKELEDSRRSRQQ